MPGACARISRAAWSPVIRGIETSSTATSGCSAWVDSRALTPSVASATTSMSGWRSISRRSPERTMPWSSAIRTRIIGSSASPRCRRRGPSARRAPRPRAGPARPCPGARGPLDLGSPWRARRGRGRSRRRRRGRAARCASSATSSSTSTTRGAGVALGVGERLLGDAVDGGLHVLLERLGVALGVPVRTSTPVRAAKRLSCASMAGTRPWSSSAEGRSWRARLSSSSMAWFTSRLSSPTSCACSGGRPGPAPPGGAGSR